MARQSCSSDVRATNFVSHFFWLIGLALVTLALAWQRHWTSVQAIAAGPDVFRSIPLSGAWILMIEVFQFLLPGAVLVAAVVFLARRRRPQKMLPDEKPGAEPDALERMGREEFYALVAKAFRREGYLVVDRSGTQSSRGVDLELFMGRDRYLVQCRHWRESKVDVGSVRELYLAISTERAVGGFIVTSGKFSDEARVLALGRSIRLVPAESLRTLLVSGSDMTISPAFSRRRDDQVPPACPHCGKAMMPRVAPLGKQSGQVFWGCTSFPACRGSRDM